MTGALRMQRLGASVADHVGVFAAAAVVLGLLAPSHGLASVSNLLLAALVLFTAPQVDPRRLTELRRRAAVIASLSVGVLVALTVAAWLIGRPFGDDLRDGVLCLGLASTEVASVGLIGLAEGDSILALGILTGSLVASAVLGPVLVGLLAHTHGHVTSFDLLARFGLVVLAPLAVGLAARAVAPRLSENEGTLSGLAALMVCALLYAAISGIHGGRRLAQDIIASLAFMGVAFIVGAFISRALAAGSELDRTAVLLTSWLRDFAVAAVLATQAFGAAAGSVAGVYGALMLLAGAGAATLIRRRSTQKRAG
ncbi:MAG: bile acid:sodium symporter [Solirubrobacteraceae bacterium]